MNQSIRNNYNISSSIDRNYIGSLIGKMMLDKVKEAEFIIDDGEAVNLYIDTTLQYYDVKIYNNRILDMYRSKDNNTWHITYDASIYPTVNLFCIKLIEHMLYSQG